MSDQVSELKQECARLEEDCLYTATAMHILLKWLRTASLGLHVLPVIFGSLGGWSLLKDSGLPITAAIFSFLAGLFPIIYKAVGLERTIATVKRVGADFRNLRDDFRRLKKVSSLGSYDTFAKEFSRYNDLLKKARQENVTIPEFIFEKARTKIQAKGHMAHDVDLGKTLTH